MRPAPDTFPIGDSVENQVRNALHSEIAGMPGYAVVGEEAQGHIFRFVAERSGIDIGGSDLCRRESCAFRLDGVLPERRAQYDGRVLRASASGFASETRSRR